jgi:hypothetical protein
MSCLLEAIDGATQSLYLARFRSKSRRQVDVQFLVKMTMQISGLDIELAEVELEANNKCAEDV